MPMAPNEPDAATPERAAARSRAPALSVVVLCYRAGEGARVERGDGLSRRLVSALYNGVFRLLFPGFPVRDVNGKPKLLTRAAYERLSLASDDWFIDAEIMIQARRLGLRVGEVETVFLP